MKETLFPALIDRRYFRTCSRVVSRACVFKTSEFCLSTGITRMQRGKYLLVLGLVSFLVLPGCSGGGRSGPKTVDVSGVVMIDGNPADGVEVHFLADKFDSYGKTDSSGKYTLVQGAVP